MMQLNPRLAAVAEWVPPGSRVADVGTDHGYLPLHLVQTGRAAAVIACDISEGPLDNARRNLEAAGASSVQLRLGDGLGPVAPDEADCITIAGMGGDLMVRIIEKASWLRDPVRLLVLQPMSASEELRAYLYTAGYVIERERAVPDHGRLYVVMAARFRGAPAPQPEAPDGLSLPLRVGPQAFIGRLGHETDPSGLAYIEKQIRRLEKWAGDIADIPRKRAEYNRLRQIIPGLRAALRREEPDAESGTDL